jgi:hypothetical protein
MAQPTQLTLAERAKNFLASHNGDAEKAVAALLKDNHKYRERLRSAESGNPYKPDERLQTENNDLRSENERLEGLVPPAGATILTGPDDGSVDQVQGAQSRSRQSDGSDQSSATNCRHEDAQRTRDDAVRQAADDLGFKPSVLVKVAKAEGLHIEFKDVTEKVDGKNVVTRVAHVRPAKDEKADLVPLEQFAENELKDYLPALLADDVEEAGGESDEEVQRPASGARAVAGVEYPVQRKGGGAVRTTPSHEKLVETARASGDYGQL